MIYTCCKNKMLYNVLFSSVSRYNFFSDCVEHLAHAQNPFHACTALKVLQFRMVFNTMQLVICDFFPDFCFLSLK